MAYQERSDFYVPSIPPPPPKKKKRPKFDLM